MEQWKQKLTMLLRDKDKQELLSREKKDRRDFDQIATVANKMGLYRHVEFGNDLLLQYAFIVYTLSLS